MLTKICFKCVKEKPVTEFYKHKAMGDGYLGKCKECTKNDVKLRYEDLSQDETYMEKERARGRDKYHRLGYRETAKRSHMENSNTRRDLKVLGIDLAKLEIHHWDYNLRNDVFFLSPKAHKLVHKFITFDPESKQFKYKENLLTTKDAHFEVIKAIFNENNVNYQIDSYPEKN